MTHDDLVTERQASIQRQQQRQESLRRPYSPGALGNNKIPLWQGGFKLTAYAQQNREYRYGLEEWV